ncbi:hypothetical protein Fmac_017339 [Flemingia macrophylla]|uniref:Uncharacterized protein n=1 Tax=Flemingia macrophylla TaxID=520843 RepID=A0ABD1M1T4_9FABA
MLIKGMFVIVKVIVLFKAQRQPPRDAADVLTNALLRLGKLVKSDVSKARVALLLLVGSMVAAGRASRRNAMNGEEGFLFRVFDSGLGFLFSGTVIMFVAYQSSLGDYESSFGDVE